MCLTQQVEGDEGEKGQGQGREKPEELLQDCWGPTSLGSSFLPVAHAERFSPKPVGRRVLSGAKYTSVGIFRGFV